MQGDLRVAFFVGRRASPSRLAAQLPAQCAIMIYKFKSGASGDLIILGPQGDQMLRLLGREPAAKGIIEPATMPAAMAALQAAIAEEELVAAEAADPPANPAKPAHPAIGLRQRLWPMVDMLRRCQVAQEPIVWGV